MSERLDPKSITGTVRAARVAAAAMGAEVFRVRDDDALLLEGIPLEPKEAIGSRSELRGKVDGVTYEIDIRFYDEQTGMAPYGNDRILDVGVFAAEGGTAIPDEYEPGRGTLGCCLMMNSDSTITADFSHGGERSNNPVAQARLDEIVRLLGVEPDEVFGKRNVWIEYDTERAGRLIDGLGNLAADCVQMSCPEAVEGS